jgi:hypothetical protein
MWDWFAPVTYPDEWHEFILSVMMSEDIQLCLPSRGVADRWLIPAALANKSSDYGRWPEFRLGRQSAAFSLPLRPMPHELMVRFICEAYDRKTSGSNANDTNLWITAAGIIAWCGGEEVKQGSGTVHRLFHEKVKFGRLLFAPNRLLTSFRMNI